MKYLARALTIIIALGNILSYTINCHYKKPRFNASNKEIQEEIDAHQKEIIEFIKQIKTIQDLQLPLPIPLRAKRGQAIPAIHDLFLRRRNAPLLELIIAKKLPLEQFKYCQRHFFYELIVQSKSQSKVINTVCELYKKYGLDISPLLNTKTCRLWTPLMLASAYGKTAVVKLLLAQGAPVNEINLYKESALHMAVWENHQRSPGKTKKIIRLLCNAHIDVNLKDKDNLTAREKAVKNKFMYAVHAIDSSIWCNQLRDMKNKNLFYFSLLPDELLQLTSEYVVSDREEKNENT